VEVNSSFHRPHRRATWERWAAVTPDHFSFAVKAPKAITHTAKLVNTGGALLEFFDAVRGLGDKLGPVLIQLPPKLTFVEGIAQEFLTTLRELHQGGVVLEPRHAGGSLLPSTICCETFKSPVWPPTHPKARNWRRNQEAGPACPIGAFTDRRALTIRNMTTTGCRG
jgi:uncharacterized protein YecE (DUF72 family)